MFKHAGKCRAAPADAAFDGAEGTAACIGNFKLRIAIDAHQNEWPLLVMGQERDGLIELLERKDVVLDGFDELALRMMIVDIPHLEPVFPQFRKEGVAQYCEQPGTKVRVRTETVAVCPCLEKGCLNQIFGEVGVGGEFQRAAAQGHGLLGQQRVEGVRYGHGDCPFQMRADMQVRHRHGAGGEGFSTLKVQGGVAPACAGLPYAAAAAFRRCSASLDRALSAPYSSSSVCFRRTAASGRPSCLAQATKVP